MANKLDLDKLRAVSKEATELYERWLCYTNLMDKMGSDPTIEQLSRASKADGKIAQQAREHARTIAADLLRLAERITAPIVCLCGSTRFTDQMLIKQWEFTKQGYIVVSWCALPESYFQGEDKTHIGDQEGVKEMVDEVHKRKIDLCDEVFVLDVDGYIGDSTRSEIQYAEKVGKPIKYYSQELTPTTAGKPKTKEEKDESI